MPEPHAHGADGGDPVTATAAPMGWRAGLVMLLGVVIGVAAFIAAAGALGIAPLWGGFAFALYWGGMLHADRAALPGALAGCCLGIAIAAALHILPVMWGTAGLAVALSIVLVAVYLLLVRRATFLVHNGTMLFLTIATIPAVAHAGDFVGAAASAVLAAALLAGLGLVTRAIAARKARPAAA